MLRLSPIHGDCHPVMIILLLFALLQDGAVAEEMSCCSKAAGTCRSVCSKVSLVSLGADPYERENATRNLAEFCSLEMVEFWTCYNSTIDEMRRNENWTGRSCCREASTPACRASCAQAGGPKDLRNCRWSDEPRLAECLEQRDESERCCASVANATCQAHCRELLLTRPGKQSALKAYSSRGCFHHLPKCLRSGTELKVAEDPKLYLHCCEQATGPVCLESCRRALHTANAVQDMIDALEEPCGPVVPHMPLWACFLNSGSSSQAGSSRVQRLPLNAAKLSCCTRAARRACQSLCWRAFHTDWSAWQQLEATCLNSSLEHDLRRCLEEAEDSCEMGCTGLSFCSRFNDRPTTLFRTCSTVADTAAKWEADHWLRGGVITGLGVPVRVAAGCPLETLRAAACLLQLRPCESRVHETRLCREDCMELMTSCVDWSAVRSHNAATLCAKLAPPKPELPCVSMRPFLEDPREQNEPPLGIDEDISMPCRSNPCSPGKICVVQSGRRRKYRCLPGCPLGEMSKQLVPVGGWAQIPRSEQSGCYKICQCTNHGSLERCRELNCPVATTCWLQNSFVAHRSSFYLECNPCRCFEGEVTCARKSCNAELRSSSLPCDCPSHYVPVCGSHGVTYASVCLAKCAGLLPTELEYGSCSRRDTCARTDACKHPHEHCLSRRRVCLAPIHKPCEQHECLSNKCEPHTDRRGPVCSSENREYSSMCALVRASVRLAYRGPCLDGCSPRGPVCGIDGERYDSECAAWAARVAVDYAGDCVAVGSIGEQPRARCAEAVACPPLARPNCLGVTPPGACCPVCAGAARLFYSKKQLDRIYYQLPDDSDKRVVTLEAMLDALSRQLQVAECALRGSLTPEGDIFILSQPISRRPSDLQLAACVAEAEKLASRVAERSPRLVAEVPLGALTWAEVAHTRVPAAGGRSSGLPSIVLILAGLLVTCVSVLSNTARFGL